MSEHITESNSLNADDIKRPFSSDLASRGIANSAVSGPSLKVLDSGDLVRINQQEHRLCVLCPEAFEPKLPAELSEAERRGFSEFLDIMRSQCCPIVSRISYRLSDKGDGITFEGAKLLTENMHELPPEFQRDLAGYFTALRRNGGTLDLKRGCIIAPPFTREHFVEQIQEIKVRTADFNWKEFVDALYDPDPGLQGFYIFDTPGAKQAYYAAMDRNSEGEFGRRFERLDELFQLATSPERMTEGLWAEYESTSAAVHQMEEQYIAAICSREKELQALCTRVRLSCDETAPDGLRATPVHYFQEFAHELYELGQILEAARDVLPCWAAGLHDVLDAQIHACGRNTGPDWGKSLQAWIVCDDPDNVFDLNLTFEEVCSTIGLKGAPLMVLSQFDEIPEDLRADLPDAGHTPHLHIVSLRTLLVAGAASGFPMMGEKLPDEDGKEHYKVQTFANVTTELGVQIEAKPIALATDATLEEVESWRDIPVANVLRHEIGHTLGTNAEFLGYLASAVEETNAEARALVGAARHDPARLPQTIKYAACWYPVFRAMQGASEAHSAAEIALNSEYRLSGGLRISCRDNGTEFVELLDPQRVAETAYAMSCRMLLWERGIPLAEQHCVKFSGLSGSDKEDRAVLREAESLLSIVPDAGLQAWRHRVVEEVEEYFSRSRLLEMTEPLLRVARCLPDSALVLPVIPTDENYRGLVRLP